MEADKERLGGIGLRYCMQGGGRALVELQVCIQEGDVREFNINDDWHLGNVREYLALYFGLKEEYSFVIENHLVHRRREKSMFCKDFTLPRYISLRRGPNM